MSKKIQWKWADLPVERDDIDHIESLSGLVLPGELTDLICKANGGFPSLKVFDSELRKGHSFKCLLSIKKESDDVTMEEAYALIKPHVGSNILPFGMDDFGNYICLDFSQSIPSVVYLDNERIADGSTAKVARNLAAFLSQLQ